MSEADKKAVEIVQQAQTEAIYDSAPSNADDELWLAYGAKMLDDSGPGLRSAAVESIKSTGILMTAYLGILGFAKFIPENMEAYNKALFVVPIVPWVIAVYYDLRVITTEIVRINLSSPTDIRIKATELLEQKQRYLELAFSFLIMGIVFAFVMVVFRLRF